MDENIIQEIRIENFKCFLDVTIPLNKLTIIAGANAVGKSTLIQALLLIRQTFEKYTEIDKFNTINEKNTEVALEIPLNGDYCLNLGNSSQIISSNAEKNEIIFTIKESIKFSHEIPFKYITYPEKPELALEFRFPSIMVMRSPTSIYRKEFHYLNAERLGPRVTQNMINQEFPSTGYQGEFTGYVLAKNQQHKIDEKRKFRSKELKVPTLNKQAEYWLNYIIPGIEITNIPYTEINQVGCYFRRTYSDTSPLNPNNIGFGISYVLPIIVSGLIAEKGSMLIVENPEAHLHPSGQSHIGQFLAQMAASGLQVIIETHSEHVINGIRIAVLKDLISSDSVCIDFFNMEEKARQPRIEHITLDKDAELSYWPYGFFDQEEKDLAEIFKGRRK